MHAHLSFSLTNGMKRWVELFTSVFLLQITANVSYIRQLRCNIPFLLSIIMYSADTAAINFYCLHFQFLLLIFTQLYTVFILNWFIYIYWIFQEVLFTYIPSFKCSFKDLSVTWVSDNLGVCHLDWDLTVDSSVVTWNI